MDWIALAQDGNGGGPCQCGNESWISIDAGKFFTGCTTGGLSSNAQVHKANYTFLLVVKALCYKPEGRGFNSR
jgi:hypothetical protein